MKFKIVGKNSFTFTSAASLILLLLTNLVTATTERSGAFRGRTYFSPQKPLEKRVILHKNVKQSTDFSRGSSDSSDSNCECSFNSESSSSDTSSCSYTSSNSETSSDYSSDYSDNLDYSPNSFSSFTSSSSRSSSGNRFNNRAYFQLPWCPGKAMAYVASQAMRPIYDWNLIGTCQQFVDNFGGISVLVGDLAGTDFCSAGPSPWNFSNYTINRALSVNEAIYARVVDPFTSVEFATAAAPILYPNGVVMYISVSKEVANLPQTC